MDLDKITLFLRIAERGSMAAAGRELGLSPATVSERLAALETYLGARLFTRTTRSLSLTEEGRELANGGHRLLAEAEELETRIRLGINRLAGPIRMSAPIDLGRGRISAILDSFQTDHPEVSVNLHLSDGYIDLFAQGCDLAVRYGDLADSSLMVRRLANNTRMICAAPSYLERNGTPQTPEDLMHHNCLLMQFGEEIDRAWPFMVDGKQKITMVKGNRVANDGGLVRDWCLSGHGIVRKSEWDIAEDLKAGRLVKLLSRYEVPPLGLQIVYPKGREQIRRVRALIERIQEHFKPVG